MNSILRYSLTAFAMLALFVTGCRSLATDARLDTDDTSIQRNVQERLDFDSVTAPDTVRVQVINGVATLQGSVRQEAVRLRATGIARATPGITDVRDELQRR